MIADPELRTDSAARLRAANVRTALVLAAIVGVFFFGFIASEYFGGPKVAIGVMGSVVLLFLILVIGRSLRK